MKYAHNNTKRGVTIFFAILIIGLLLGIAASISLLSQKQVTLSSVSKQSELAFYSADSAIECVVYWDQNTGSANPFDFSTTSSSAVINCNNQNITVCSNSNPSLDSCQSESKSFQIPLGNTCASTTIIKEIISGVTTTQITAYGYNTSCSGSSSRRLQRALQVGY